MRDENKSLSSSRSVDKGGARMSGISRPRHFEFRPCSIYERDMADWIKTLSELRKGA